MSTSSSTTHTDQLQQKQHDRPKPGILPALPDISATISSILSSTPPDSNPARTSQQSNAPSSLASYLPASVSAAPMTAWFKKPAAKSAIKSPRVASRDSSPSKSVVFSVTSRDDSSNEFDRRESHDTHSTRGRRSKRNSRPKSSYTICYAPPRSANRHKIQVRARPLLQLHKLESRARPRPEFELLPSAIFSARLNKAITRFSASKQGSHADLALVRAEKYHEHEASLVDEDETMDILATFGITKGSHGESTARICLAQGVEWEMYRLPSGGYECTTTDAHGLKRTVRWVPKKSKSADGAADDSASRRFKFSTISPNSRRHPVVASLSAAALDINDVYTLPSPASSRAGSPPVGMERSESTQTIGAGEQTVVTTEELRHVITATAVFVSLCEGWCAGYQKEAPLSRSPSQRSASSVTSPMKRNMSLDRESLRRNSSMRQALSTLR